MDNDVIIVGYQLPTHSQGPISRATLALFAGASNDHVPLHIDSDYAKSAGMDDVFGHGMLSMAYLAQMLTHWRPQASLLRWNVRFTAITPLYATVNSTGEVAEILEEAGRRVARINIRTTTDAGLVTMDGEAFVALD
ncbi:MAG: MaoC/PaaZ C-terminal domain-containing protein [Sphingomonadaceae bacterium]